MNATGFFDVLDTALQCVCDQMEEIAVADATYPGCPCVVFVSAGEPVIECCTSCSQANGRLTVHLEDVFASDNFPDATATYEPCKAQTWVAAIVVTIARCLDLGDSEPEPQDIAAAARIQAMDAYAVTSALGCCLVSSGVGNKRKRRVLVTGASPLTEQGGCMGLEVRALVECGTLCACSQDS